MERSFLGVTAPISEGLGPGSRYEKAAGEWLGPDPLYQPQAHQVGHWISLQLPDKRLSSAFILPRALSEARLGEGSIALSVNKGEGKRPPEEI